MLRFRLERARRAAGVVLSTSPKRRSNTSRGSFSIGSGVVGVRQESVFAYAQLQPDSQAPSRSLESRQSSREESGVSLPRTAAASWSIDTPARMSGPSVFLGCVPLRNAADART